MPPIHVFVMSSFLLITPYPNNTIKMDVTPTQFRAIVERVLKYMSPEIPYSKNARELLMVTAAHESHLGKYPVKVSGPNRGIFQIAKIPEWEVIAKLRCQYPLIYRKLMALNVELPNETNDDLDSIYNIAWQIALARCYYFLKPGPIPSDLDALVVFYKKYWNTHEGKATVEAVIRDYKLYACGG